MFARCGARTLTGAQSSDPLFWVSIKPTNQPTSADSESPITSALPSPNLLPALIISARDCTTHLRGLPGSGKYNITRYTVNTVTRSLLAHLLKSSGPLWFESACSAKHAWFENKFNKLNVEARSYPFSGQVQPGESTVAMDGTSRESCWFLWFCTVIQVYCIFPAIKKAWGKLNCMCFPSVVVGESRLQSRPASDGVVLIFVIPNARNVPAFLPWAV